MKSIAAVLLLAACAGRPHVPAEPGIDLSGLDTSVAPGDDFFAYANGGWAKTHDIPPDRASIGVWDDLVERTAQRTAALIADTAKTPAPAGSDAKKVGDYYATYLDEATIEQKGLTPLRPTLERIAAIRDHADLARVIGETLRADVDVLNTAHFDTDHLFGLWVAADLDDPTRYSPFLLQGGLGLPDRGDYLDDSPHMVELRKQYQEHLARVHEVAGIPDGARKAARIFELERKIAKVHAPRVDTESVEKGNNHWKRSEFATRAPGLDWDAFFAAAGLDRQPEFVVWQPAAIAGISALVRSEPLATWKEYLTLRALEHWAGVLPKALADESFAFYGKILSGIPQQRDRWKRAVDATNEALGMAIGKLYVERWFPPAEKARAEQLVKNEISAFARRIDALTWMTPGTQEKAKAKLAALEVSLGYPETWRDYSGLEVVRGDAFGNAERAELFEYRRNLAKLGQPVDRREWVMNPQLVNAVNLPAMNALQFPAAILQPPFFDATRKVAMDYGAIGAIIGHEISHCFDDQGALFGPTGKLENWWTPEDFAHFRASSAKLVAQYDAYEPLPGVHENGKLTSSENIADVAGLAVAYDAYHAADPAAGRSTDQQFFLSFAQSWRTKMRDALVRQLVLIDGHSLPEYRAATVRNLDPWYAAFDVRTGQRLYLLPAERVRVW